MYLKTLINELRRCHLDDRDEVFLLAQHDQPLTVPTARGRDKDIWSLVGPLPLGRSRSDLQLVEEEPERNRDERGEAEEAASNTDYMQQLILLVFGFTNEISSLPGLKEVGKTLDDVNSYLDELVNKADAQNENRQQLYILVFGRDKDVWSLAGSVSPEVLVARLSEPYRSAA